MAIVLLDYDFNTESNVFDFDAVFYADTLEKANWEVRFPVEAVGGQVMAIFVDVYGNEAREVIPGSKFVASTAKTAKKTGRRKKRKG